VTQARLARVTVGGTPDAWRAAGFAVDEHGCIPFVNGALELTDSGVGMLGLVIDGLGADDVLPADLEGIPLSAGRTVAALDHPNGAFELDHIVIMTDSLERTSDAVTAALGLERRRIRETADVRQAFHRFADRGCIIEIVERAGLDHVGLWGLVVNVADLEAVIETQSDDMIGAAKNAVQPGRRIATFRSGAGLGVPVALMTPDR
jgi:hypothetical protein